MHPLSSQLAQTASALAMSIAIGLLWSTDALARDRYRCTPADGSAAYTSRGTCRADSDTRTPLTEQDIADMEEVKSRGKPFYRCTAADGSYSTFIHTKEKTCPSPTDTLTVEYARKPIRVETPAPPAEPVQLPALDPADIDALSKLKRQFPTSTPSPFATPAAPAAAPPSASPERTGTGIVGKLVLLLLAVLALAWFLRARSQRSSRAEAAEREARAQAIAQRHSPGAGAQQRPGKTQPPAANTIDMQQKARDFLAALQSGVNVPGGTVLSPVLAGAGLDYSMDSLDRMDQLLRQIKTEFSPERENWRTLPGAEDCCLTLAFYLGEMISRQARQPIQWLTHDQAAPMCPADMPLPDADWSRVVGVIAASMCLPLALIEEALFDESASMGCRAYVDKRVASLPKAAPKDENERCTQMLEAFFSGGSIVGQLAFREPLQSSRLDHSLASLERLDQLLRSIRDEVKPTYGDFVNKPDSQNFIRLVAFYIGMTTARAGKVSVKWLDFEQTRQEIKELEFGFEATSVCLLAGRFYFLLGLVTEILFDPAPKRSVHGWASDTLSIPSQTFVSILQSSTEFVEVRALDAQTAQAANRAGFVAAWCMFMVAGGSTGKPTVFTPGQGDQGGLFTDFGFYDTLEAGIAAASTKMSQNPQQAPFQVMSSDGYANLHTGRTDALTIELRIYGAPPTAAREVVFKMMVSCPYRNAEDPKGFAIFSPKLVDCSGSALMHSAIFKHFYLGIQEFTVNDFHWSKYLDERI